MPIEYCGLFFPDMVYW